ncbi:hypothetical protein GGX14DRAFT_404185 [Mycena pura]|uniref:Uncharacterized protein n=1 Tax=Mycena pura TaxID=153505 RepID=A0AAD6Y7N8_9AGAR|nr:hypothetical protein GGX14DRAFT_404185 [Mycena pura]
MKTPRTPGGGHLPRIQIRHWQWNLYNDDCAVVDGLTTNENPCEQEFEIHKSRTFSYACRPHPNSGVCGNQEETSTQAVTITNASLDTSTLLEAKQAFHSNLNSLLITEHRQTINCPTRSAIVSALLISGRHGFAEHMARAAGDAGAAAGMLACHWSRKRNALDGLGQLSTSNARLAGLARRVHAQRPERASGLGEHGPGHSCMTRGCAVASSSRDHAQAAFGGQNARTPSLVAGGKRHVADMRDGQARDDSGAVW